MKPWLRVLLPLLMGGCLFVVAQVPRTNFPLTFLLYTLAFACMLGTYFDWKKEEVLPIRQLLLLGLLLRVSVFFFVPQWSEDALRFLWDGELLRLGHNPYLLTPADLQVQGEGPAGTYGKQLFETMNSPDYYSVYPPLNQAFFWLGAQVAQGNVLQGILGLRLLLLLGEVGVFYLLIYLLANFQLPQKQVLLYWFNPLVVLEVVGNLHFEGMVLLFLLASVAALVRHRFGFSGAFWGLAVGMKLLPFLLAPAFFFWKGLRKPPRFWGVALGTLVLAFLPLLFSTAWENFFQSLRLYQGKFEFNASLYYLFRTIGFWLEGFNTIWYLTKVGMGITLVGLLWLSWKQSTPTVPGFVGLWVQLYLLYFLLQPVVHPWYVLPGLGLSLLTRKWTFVLWSFGVIFSYQAYGQNPVQEQPLFLILEYGLVLLGLYLDYFRKQRTSNLGV
jgi:alpha-1,6-mannosyltransferase